MRKEIVIEGTGGQGIQLMGEILAKALNLEGYDAAYKSNYGPEARGGRSFAQIVIKDSPEDWPEVMTPDILIALSQEGYNARISEVSLESKVFFDVDLVKTILPAKAQHIPVLATRVANELGLRVVVNMVMLGAIVAVTRLVLISNLFEVVKKETGKFSAVNLDAVREGYKLGKKYLMHQKR